MGIRTIVGARRARGIQILAALFLFMQVPSVAAEPPQGGAGWTLKSLDLDVSVLPERSKIEVEGRAVLRLEIETSLGPTLCLNGKSENMAMLRLDTEPPAASVVLNQAILPGLPNLRATHVRFDRPRTHGDEITVEFACESIGQGSQFKAVPTMVFGSWTETWHPVPLFDPGVVSLSKALASTGRTRFHLPPGWSAATEGVMVSREETTGGVTETWRLDTPLARSFAAGPFAKATFQAEQREIHVFMVSPDLAKRAQEQARTLARALTAMERRFGPYPYPSYGIIEIPPSLEPDWYAASQQGLIFAQTAGFEAEGGNLPLFAHEMAHGWWGNLVGTGGPGSILCSESLAQYGAVVAIEALEGVAARDEFLHFSRAGYSALQSANGYYHIWRRGHDKALRDLESGGWDHDLSDSKGHWVYHMLRGRVGDDVFFETLRGLLRSYAGKRLTLADLRAAFIDAAPDQDVATFFAQWLDRPGAPVLDLDWWSVENGAGVHVEVKQLQPGEPYHLNLGLEIEYLGGETHLEMIELTEASQSFDIETERRPVGLRLDPRSEWLIWRPEYGPRPADAPLD